MPLAILVAMVIALFLSVRDGHSWSGDYAAYLLHARNLMQGRPYAETGYVYNPDYPQLGPRAYPPVFPSVLAVAQWAGIQTLKGLKQCNLLIFGVGLAFVMLLFQPWFLRDGLFPWVFAAMLPLAHVVWFVKDLLYSDLLFFTLFWAGLLFYQRRLACRKRIHWSGACAAGLLWYAAIGCRTIGLALLPIVCISDAIHHRRVRGPVILAVVVTCALFLLQSWWLPSSGYLDQFEGAHRRWGPQALAYVQVLGLLFFDGVRGLSVQPVVALAGLILMGGGVAVALQRKLVLPLITGGVYLAAVLAWPTWQGPRFLLPLVPVAAWLLLLPAIGLLREAPRRIGQLALLMLVAGSVALGLARGHYAQGTPGPHQPDAQLLFAWMRRNTGENDVVLFRKPRILTLYTGRPAGTWNPAADRAAFNAFVVRSGASWVVDGLLDTPRIQAHVRAQPGRFEAVQRIGRFTVFSVRPSGSG